MSSTDVWVTCQIFDASVDITPLQEHEDERLANPIAPARDSAVDLRVGLKTPYRGAISDERHARLLVEDIAREVDSNLSGLPNLNEHGEAVHWERTAYKGEHLMICEVLDGSRIVAKGTKRIRIGTK